MGLFKKPVNKGRFSVVDMRNNRNISNSVFLHNLVIISLFRGKEKRLWYEFEPVCGKISLMDKDAIKNLRSIAGNFAIFVLLIVLTFWFVFKDQDFGKIIGIIGETNLIFVLIGLAVMFGYFVVEAWNIRTLLAGFGEKISMKDALRYTLIGFFFCSVTPGASGGQPLEIYYMSKDGISSANATMAILIQTCGVQVAVVGLGIIFLIFSPQIAAGPIMSLFMLGVLINGVALAALLVAILSPKLAKKMINWGLNFLKKIHIRRFEKNRKSINDSLAQYSEASAYIKEHKKEFRNAMMRTVLQMTLYYLVPYFVYLSFGLSEMTALGIVAMQSVLFIATSGLPIPGAIGASEAVFLGLYGAVYGAENVESALILTRGSNFYLFVIVAMVVTLLNMLRLQKGTKKE